MTEANDKAFANPGGRINDYVVYPAMGLTKREYFAAMAMQGLSTLADKGTYSDMNEALQIMSKMSVDIADALISQLNSKPCQP